MYVIKILLVLLCTPIFTIPLHLLVHDGTRVAVKVQYPGVAASIESDLSYLRTLASMSSLLPKGLYLDNTIKVARRELGWECDYVREAESTETFRGLVDAVYKSKYHSRYSGLRINVPRVVAKVPL
jgi:predicted unusual protein kinase regulating ubiquinone biosynthesis (AarF/ABC1/UbiB family)